MPQLLKPARLEPMLHNKRSHCNEKPAHHNEEQPPLAATRRKPMRSSKDPPQPKINKFLKKKKKKPINFFFFKYFVKLIYLFLAALSLRCCVWTISSCSEGGATLRCGARASCILLSIICPNFACTQLFLVPHSFFVFCCLRRHLSRCKHCSKGPQVPACPSMVPSPWGSWVGSQAPLSSLMVPFEPCQFGPLLPLPLTSSFNAGERLPSPLPHSVSHPGRRSGGNRLVGRDR